MEPLASLQPVSERYATAPVADAFNWDEAADEERLTHFDEMAHQEAAASPGFVHYFKGPRAHDGSCLSFCLWESRAHARAAAGQPAHVRAVGLLEEMYEADTLEFQRVPRVAD